MYVVEYFQWYDQDHLSGDWENTRFEFHSKHEAIRFAENRANNSEVKHIKVYKLIKDFDK